MPSTSSIDIKNKVIGNYEILDTEFLTMDNRELSSTKNLKDFRKINKNINYIENQSIGKYRIIRTLGKGSSAKVVLAEEEITEFLFAIKIVERKKSGISDKRIFREILISSLLNHPHIVKLIDFYYTENFFFLIFEYIEGCQLYDLVLKTGKIEEPEARKYFRQIISAIDYVHSNSITHRDLKIENILIDKNDNVKIIDFGLSNFYDSTQLLSTFCGSLYFAAPELLSGKRYLGPEVDVWSLGIVLYVLLCGKVPFDDESIRMLQNKIKSCKYEITSNISLQAKDLILNMILPTSDGRYTLDQVKKSEWLNIDHQGLLHNFMVEREPLTGLNENILKALSVAAKFQFKNVEKDLRLFLKICQREKGSLGQSQMLKNPIISLYYLMIEKFNSQSFTTVGVEEIKSSSCDFINESDFPLILHNFVRYTLNNDDGSFFNQYYMKSLFVDDPQQEFDQSEKYPGIKKSYIQGFFKGIKIKNMEPENLKKLILQIFIENNVIYEVNEKSYFCSFYYKNTECFFKLTIYFNIILSEHYIVLTCINKKKDAFKVIYKLIKDSIYQRTKT